MKQSPTAVALARLRHHAAAKAEPFPVPSEGKLPLASLTCIEAAFQPRCAADDHAERQWLVEELKKALERNGAEGLDPILVWWSGQNWIVLDGHHRLAAYRAYETAHAHVKVEVFEGGIHVARLEAVRRNAKTALMLTQHERLQAAWKLTCTSDLTKQQLAVATATSPRTIANMRSRLKVLEETLGRDWSRTRLADVSWRQVQMKGFPDGGGDEFDDDLTLQLGREWAGRFKKVFGRKPVDCPEAFALAISLFSPALPMRLMATDAWAGDSDDFRHDCAIDADEDGQNGEAAASYDFE